MSDSDLKVADKAPGSEVAPNEESFLDEIYEILDAVVPRTDDVSLPALTFRVWVLGLVFGCLICAANTVFTFRTNTFTISPFVTVLMAYPCGLFMARALPKGFFNPGPFNYKEHALIYVITSAMASTPYALYNIIGQKYQLYQSDLNLGWCVVFAIVTQCFGYGFAGLTRRYLVRPPTMLWPSNLATIAMLNSLHGNDDPSNGRYPMSRYKFFWLVTSAMF
ncbi:OPT oligopeptide transporter protein-domain-containing protein, partial [Chytriomyces sp. MP71]